MTATRPAGYYRERSRRCLDLADDLLARDEPEAAGEMLWGAAALAVKTVAQRRRWRHDTHALLRNAVDRLVYERGAPPHLLGQYAMASECHAGFYGDRMFTAVQIRYGREPIAEFVGALETLD